jgi:hypothetical protein
MYLAVLEKAESGNVDYDGSFVTPEDNERTLQLNSFRDVSDRLVQHLPAAMKLSSRQILTAQEDVWESAKEESEVHEDTGNAGAEAEKWYRLVALVLWPVDRAISVRTKLGLEVLLNSGLGDSAMINTDAPSMVVVALCIIHFAWRARRSNAGGAGVTPIGSLAPKPLLCADSFVARPSPGFASCVWSFTPPIAVATDSWSVRCPAPSHDRYALGFGPAHSVHCMRLRSFLFAIVLPHTRTCILIRPSNGIRLLQTAFWLR